MPLGDEAVTPAAGAHAALRPRLAAELLRAGRVVEIPVGGASMRPLFAPGDRLTIAPARADEVAAGDVVVLAVGDALVVHRLVYKSDAGVVTRGDDAPACDPPAPTAAVVGRVDVPASPRALYCALRALFR